MNPQQFIRDLDAFLQEIGQTIILRRGNTTVGQISVRGIVRGVTADDLIGEVTQTDRRVVISPSGLGAFGEPDASISVVIDGKPSQIVGKPELIRLNDVLVRINMVVKG